MVTAAMKLKDAWRRKWQPTPVFLLGKSHGAWRATGHGAAESQRRLSEHRITHSRGGSQGPQDQKLCSLPHSQQAGSTEGVHDHQKSRLGSVPASVFPAPNFRGHGLLASTPISRFRPVSGIGSFRPSHSHLSPEDLELK